MIKYKYNRKQAGVYAHTDIFINDKYLGYYLKGGKYDPNGWNYILVLRNGSYESERGFTSVQKLREFLTTRDVLVTPTLKNKREGEI